MRFSDNTRIPTEDLGLEPARLDQLEGGDVACNANWFRTILRGQDDGPRSRHTALNAGAAFLVAGLVEDLASGVARAQEVIASGKAIEVVEAYAALIGSSLMAADNPAARIEELGWSCR